MQVVADHIEKRLTRHKQEFVMDRWLSDQSVPVWERCSWWRINGAFLHIAIEDVFSMLLKYPNPGDDPGKKVINELCEHSESHRQKGRDFYLADFNTLGLNKVLSFAESVDFLWDEQRDSMRRSMYKLAVALHKSETAPLRYAAAIPLGAYAKYYYPMRAKADREYEEKTGKKLLYATSIELPDYQKWDEHFLKIELEATEREQALKNAMLVADAMESAMHENYQFSIEPAKRTLWESCVAKT